MGGGTAQVIVLVHGINTRALWIDVVKPTLESHGFFVAPAGYGRYSVFRFLLPFKALRKAAIERVWRHIVTANKLFGPCEMSVIAHSFGTYIVARVLAEHPEIQWKRIIFCGSAVKDTYPLYQYLDRFEPHS